MNPRRRLGLGALLLAATGTVGCEVHRPDPVGLPAFSLLDVEGRKITREDVTGRPLLLNFWSPSCEPCLREMPLLAKFQREHPTLRIIAVAAPSDPPNVIVDYARRNAFPFTMAFDLDGSAAAVFGPLMGKTGANARPVSLLYDAKGQWVMLKLGMWSEAELRGAVRALDKPR